MQRRNMRVILASEYPDVQHFLRGVVEQEDGVIVGQAKNAIKALTLARQLRPDVALVDCYLPHTVGVDSVALSRIGGLDAAQAISQESPKTRVVLIPNLSEESLSQHALGSDSVAFFATKTNGSIAPFDLQALYRKVALADSVIFANVEMKPRTIIRQQSRLTDKAIFFGGLSFVGGWFLVLTIFLAPIGIGVAAAGAVSMLLGFAGKLVASLRSKVATDKQAGDIAKS